MRSGLTFSVACAACCFATLAESFANLEASSAICRRDPLSNSSMGSGEGGPAEVENGMEANRERVEDLDEIAVTRDGDVADEGAGGRATVSTAARNEGMGRTGAQQGRSSSRPGSDPAG